MPISNRPWADFTEADYTPEQFCRAALIDLNPSGEPKTKGLCKLPVREPDGTLNRNGVHSAAGGAGGAGAGGGARPVGPPPGERRARGKDNRSYRQGGAGGEAEAKAKATAEQSESERLSG